MNLPDFGVFLVFQVLWPPNILCMSSRGWWWCYDIFFAGAALNDKHGTGPSDCHLLAPGMVKTSLAQDCKQVQSWVIRGESLSRLSSATFVPQAAWFALSGCVYCTCVVTSVAARDTNTSSSLHCPWRGGPCVLTWVRDHVKWPWPHLPTILLTWAYSDTLFFLGCPPTSFSSFP